jgi:hypothetical protein
MKTKVSLLENSFSKDYRGGAFDNEMKNVAKNCSGCLYGSYPEISISARFLLATLERAKLFTQKNRHEIAILDSEKLEQIANKFRSVKYG